MPTRKSTTKATAKKKPRAKPSPRGSAGGTIAGPSTTHASADNLTFESADANTQPFHSLLGELAATISHRRYDETERIGNELLDLSPSEEVDRCLHEIISSATTIRDAEDEIRYQLDDLRTALAVSDDSPEGFEISEVDGL